MSENVGENVGVLGNSLQCEKLYANFLLGKVHAHTNIIAY